MQRVSNNERQTARKGKPHDRHRIKSWELGGTRITTDMVYSTVGMEVMFVKLEKLDVSEKSLLEL